jgi:hypothetical protein
MNPNQISQHISKINIGRGEIFQTLKQQRNAVLLDKEDRSTRNLKYLFTRNSERISERGTVARKQTLKVYFSELKTIK